MGSVSWVHCLLATSAWNSMYSPSLSWTHLSLRKNQPLITEPFSYFDFYLLVVERKKWTRLQKWGVEAVRSQTPTSDDIYLNNLDDTNTNSSLVNYTTPTFSFAKRQNLFYASCLYSFVSSFIFFLNFHLFPIAPLFLWVSATYPILSSTLSLAPFQP